MLKLWEKNKMWEGTHFIFLYRNSFAHFVVQVLLYIYYLFYFSFEPLTQRLELRCKLFPRERFFSINKIKTTTNNIPITTKNRWIVYNSAFSNSDRYIFWRFIKCAWIFCVCEFEVSCAAKWIKFWILPNNKLRHVNKQTFNELIGFHDILEIYVVFNVWFCFNVYFFSFNYLWLAPTVKQRQRIK